MSKKFPSPLPSEDVPRSYRISHTNFRIFCCQLKNGVKISVASRKGRLHLQRTFDKLYPKTQPDELVDFALAYFTRLKAKRNAIAAENNNLSDESMLSEDEEFGECSTQRAM